MMNTQTAAEKMLETGLFYSALELGREFNEGATRATGWLSNMRTCEKYTVIETELPNRKVKLVSINGRTTALNQLQNQALLFKRPSLLIGSSSHV
ncbi:hypothetical protein [Pseudoalteromonas sp. GW168-MNA-CIBAN-0100]|uniref:hypothetical protein n=1 Tax=Pseudoalteromonas sp. GW168-MNA-CIBAN-0100 TaxID=3140434 RepID=UPI003325E958